MHELYLLGIPLLGGPLFALRMWLARRHMTQPGALDIGQRLPDVGPLPTTTRDWVHLGKGEGPLVVVFMSNRCPGVKAYDSRLRMLHARFAPQRVRFVGVNPVPEELYPRENLAGMRQAAKERGIAFPYAKDLGQRLMAAVGAVCTPQVFLFDEERILRYRGRIDDSFVESRARQHDLRDALNDVLAHRAVQTPETPALGCSIDTAPSSTLAAPTPAGVPA